MFQRGVLTADNGCSYCQDSDSELIVYIQQEPDTRAAGWVINKSVLGYRHTPSHIGHGGAAPTRDTGHCATRYQEMGTGASCLELQRNLREDFTIKDKAPATRIYEDTAKWVLTVNPCIVSRCEIAMAKQRS